MTTETLFSWKWKTWEGYKGESRIVRRWSDRDERAWSGIEIHHDWEDNGRMYLIDKQVHRRMKK